MNRYLECLFFYKQCFKKILTQVRNKELLNNFFFNEKRVQLYSMKTKIYLIQHIILGGKPSRMSCWIIRIQRKRSQLSHFLQHLMEMAIQWKVILFKCIFAPSKKKQPTFVNKLVCPVQCFTKLNITQTDWQGKVYYVKLFT